MTLYKLHPEKYYFEENHKWHKAKREANGHFRGVRIFLYILFSDSIFYSPPTHPYLQFMQIEKTVRFNGRSLRGLKFLDGGIHFRTENFGGY